MYLVVLHWNDRTETYFFVRAFSKDDATEKAKKFAVSQEWGGVVTSVTVTNIDKMEDVHHIVTK